jgi:hypothetical protein
MSSEEHRASEPDRKQSFADAECFNLSGVYGVRLEKVDSNGSLSSGRGA